ncbi:hypothetical protein [Vitreimonas sp.]|uniref:hypothetical protein n=1 Tax=Vitreimonas sp. TaxID=3069702 RepID=UPI002EDA761A
MKAPEIWGRMGAYVHQDFLLQFPDLMSGLIDFLSEEPREQRAELHRYCDFLLRRPETIAAAWNSTDTNLLLNSVGAKQLVEDIRAYLTTV